MTFTIVNQAAPESLKMFADFADLKVAALTWYSYLINSENASLISSFDVSDIYTIDELNQAFQGLEEQIVAVSDIDINSINTFCTVE